MVPFVRFSFQIRKDKKRQFTIITPLACFGRFTEQCVAVTVGCASAFPCVAMKAFCFSLRHYDRVGVNEAVSMPLHAPVLEAGIGVGVAAEPCAVVNFVLLQSRSVRFDGCHMAPSVAIVARVVDGPARQPVGGSSATVSAPNSCIEPEER